MAASALLGLAVGLGGCGGAKGAAPGTEGGDCLPNGTCPAPLRCFSNLCVRYDGGASGQGGGPGGGGAPDAEADAPANDRDTGEDGPSDDLRDAPAADTGGDLACRPDATPTACDDRTPVSCGASGTFSPRAEGPCCGTTPFCVGGTCARCPSGGATQCALGSGGGLVNQTCGGGGWFSLGTPASIAACGATCGSTPSTFAAPSCAGGGPGAGKNCGKAGTEDCCVSPFVPCGVSNRPATVSDFRLDKYEITIGRFRSFVAAGKKSSAAAPPAGAGANPHTSGSGWNPAWNHFLDEYGLVGRQLWTTDVGPSENAPMTQMTWFEAFAFCIWDGGRLPTEAEWTYAATGGDQQRAYPWGDMPWNNDISLAIGGCRYDGNPLSCTDADVAPVGSAPAGNARWGQADLAGNAMEWVLDYFEAAELPCIDCAQLQCGGLRINRGGSQTDTTLLRNDQQHFNDPADAVGARCARAP